MWTFLVSLLSATNFGKRIVLHNVELLLLNWVAMMAMLTTTIVVANVSNILNFWVTAISLGWLIATFFTLYGNLNLLIIAAEAVEKDKPKAEKLARNIILWYFWIECSVAIFFIFFPIFKSWAGGFAFLVLLVGYLIGRHKAGKDFNWDAAWKVYGALMALTLVGTLASYGYDVFTGKGSLTGEIIINQIKSFYPTGPGNLLGRMMFFPTILGAIGILTVALSSKKALKITGGWITTLSVVAVIVGFFFWTFPEAQAKVGLLPEKKPGLSSPMVPSGGSMPANAKLKKTLAANEVFYLSRNKMEFPPPACWSRVNGREVPEKTWHQGAKHWAIRNSTNAPLELYLACPAGTSLDDFPGSSTDPVFATSPAMNPVLASRVCPNGPDLVPKVHRN